MTTQRRPRLLKRRALMAACVAVPVAAMSVGAASADPSTELESLPEGQTVGAVAATADDGTQIFEVVDSKGDVTGYTIDAGVRHDLRDVGPELQEESGKQGAVQPMGTGTDVALCVAAIGWFVAQTVFPSVRVANLAVQLGRLVAKYGAKTVARIIKGARGVGSRTAQQEVKDFALAASGIGGLAACGI